MQVTEHEECHDADNQRFKTELEFEFDKDDKRRIDQTFNLDSHAHDQTAFYSTVCNDGKFYTLVVNRDYEVLEWY